MFRRTITFPAAFLAGALVLSAPGRNLAADHHGGGGHSSGGHSNAGHYSGGHAGPAPYNGAHHANDYHGGNYHHDGGHYDRDHHGRYPYGYPYSYYGYRGYYPYSSIYGYSSPAYYDGYPYGRSDYLYGYSGYNRYAEPYYGRSIIVVPPVNNYRTLESSATLPSQPDNSAHMSVVVPADARVSFDGQATTTTGTIRQFDTPALTPGREYEYEITAVWTENGREVTQSRKVDVTPGSRVIVRFPSAPTTAEQPPISEQP